MTVLQAQNICKTFDEGTRVLNSINLKLHKGESIAIVGKSGSGKSTFLQICGLLDDPTEGEIEIDREPCLKLSDYNKTLIRRHKIGFVYQFHHLLSEFSVIENLVIPQLICGVNKFDAQEKAKSYLNRFDLLDKSDSFIQKLSGGERQRVAILRSIIHSPKVILADEPTGNLDYNNAAIAFDLLKEVLQDSNAGMLIATHSLELARMCSRALILENGNLREFE